MSEARIWTLWDFDPGVWVFLGLLALGYLVFVRFRPKAESAWWGAALAVLIVALDSPLAVLGEHYLFSAHMLQHMLLEFVAAPMLVAGLPREDLARVLATRWGGAVGRFLARPVLALVVGLGTLWIWHLPPLFEATLHSDAVHAAMHISFIFTGAWFWFPILSRSPVTRLRPIPALLMLFTAALLNSVLGIILTFAPAGIYPTYVHPEDPYGVLPIIRDQWGFSADFDQAFGGVLMWTLGGIIFLGAIILVLTRWINDVGADEGFGHRAEGTS